MPGFYKPTPNETHAYAKSGNDEYYGWASSGTLTSEAQWQIVKMEYTNDNWVEKYPVDDNTGMGSDQPIFEWDNVLTYTYRILGCKA